MKYDLSERCLNFGSSLLAIYKQISRFNEHIALQLLRSGTSIGANYEESQHYESSNDFLHKVSIARKEARETVYWLRLLLVDEFKDDIHVQNLAREAEELNKILSKIYWSTKKSRIKL